MEDTTGMMERIKDIFYKTTKINKWWIYKIGSGGFTFILFKYIFGGNAFFSFLNWNDLILFLILLLLAIEGHFINDYSDFQFDKKAGKRNIFNHIKTSHASGIIFLIGSIILASSIFFFSTEVSILIALQIGCSILYSLKPFRIKERGLIALLLTGLYERTLPFLIIILAIAPNISLISVPVIVFSITYLLWSYLWECRNFINGQVNDYNDDLKTNTLSIAITYGLKKIELLKTKIMVSEIIVFMLWFSLWLEMNRQDLWYILIIFAIPILYHWIHSNTVFTNKEALLDYYYNYTILANLLIYLMVFQKIAYPLALLLFFLFQSDYLKKGYDFIRHLLSKIVNYSIYYFRKYILKWSESQSRGQKE